MFQCPDCGKEFTRKFNMEPHRIVSHGDSNSEADSEESLDHVTEASDEHDSSDEQESIADEGDNDDGDDSVEDEDDDNSRSKQYRWWRRWWQCMEWHKRPFMDI